MSRTSRLQQLNQHEQIVGFGFVLLPSHDAKLRVWTRRKPLRPVAAHPFWVSTCAVVVAGVIPYPPRTPYRPMGARPSYRRLESLLAAIVNKVKQYTLTHCFRASCSMLCMHLGMPLAHFFCLCWFVVSFLFPPAIVECVVSTRTSSMFCACVWIAGFACGICGHLYWCCC